ncbi:MAG: DUF3341 domain-containing protein [Flavobacteriales bacterium AspAUS03]
MSKATTNIVYGLYDDDDVLLDGIKFLKSKGIKINEVYTPFPVHGLDKALDLKETRISKLAFVYSLFGTILATVLTWYTMNYDWPQDIGGKSSSTWYMNMPAFVPIMFELIVFCTAHFMCITYLIRCRLFPGTQPQNPDPRTTDDKFLIELRTEQDTDDLISSLKESGAIEITVKKLAS